MSAEKPSGNPLVLAQGSRLRFRRLEFLDILGNTRNLRLTGCRAGSPAPRANAHDAAGGHQGVDGSAFGRPNAVPIYRFNQVGEYLYVPCGPTGTVELTLQ